MKLILSTLLFFALNSLYAEDISRDWDNLIFKNFREADSRFITSDISHEVDIFSKNEYDREKIMSLWFSKKNVNCASLLIEEIKQEMDLQEIEKIKIPLLFLRSKDLIDDITLNILYKALNQTPPLITAIAQDKLNEEQEKSALEIYNKWTKQLSQTSCPEDSFRILYGELAKSSMLFIKNLKHLNREAMKKGIISKKHFKSIEAMRINKVHQWPLTLSEYGQKIAKIFKRYPQRTKERSQIITSIKYSKNTSMRQRIFEQFDPTQVSILAKSIKELKARLEAKEISISISYENAPTEIISLSPMEKFRFILKLMRKELAQLNNGSLLDGRRATYFDLIAASYELGFISASEIEQLVKLEEIWNPQKSNKEKVMYWLKTFGNPASILLPPPLGFASLLALMIIDQYISEAPINHDLDFILF